MSRRRRSRRSGPASCTWSRTKRHWSRSADASAGWKTPRDGVHKFDTGASDGYSGRRVLMDERDVVRDLVAKLIEAVEASLDSSPAVREALDELVRNGFEPRLILLADASARSADTEEEAAADDAPEASDGDHGADADEDLEEARDLQYELTKLDRDFLRTVRIRPESG